MLPALTILGGVLLVVLETVFLRLFGVVVFAPQVAVIIIVYAGMSRSFSLGAIATLIFAAVADLCWGGPRGYYALGLTAAFFAATLVRVQWQPRRVLSVAIIAIPMVLVTDTVALVALALFRRGSSPLDALVVVTYVVVAFSIIVQGLSFGPLLKKLYGSEA